MSNPNSINVDAILEQACEHHEAGRYLEAEVLYRRILESQPHHADALHLLGVLAAQHGQTAMAIELIGRAVAIAPLMAAAHSNLGNALREHGDNNRAIAAYHTALQLDPTSADTYSNLGNAFRDLADLSGAIASYRESVRLAPTATGLNNLGVALRDSGSITDAIAAFRRAAILAPQSSQVQYNLALALRADGQLHEAAVVLRQVIALEPANAEAHGVLGQLLANDGQREEAVEVLRRAITLAPNYAEAYRALGEVLERMEDLDGATQAFAESIQLNANQPEVYLSLSRIYCNIGRLSDALASLDRAIALAPEDPKFTSARVFLLMFLPAVSDKAILRAARHFNQVHCVPLRPLIIPCANDPQPDRRLRIGYVSACFKGHVAALYLVPLIRSHDRSRVEIFCYSGVEKADSFTDNMRQSADAWRDILHLSDADRAELIRRDRIDILVDLTMHMGGNFLTLFARKPAPIQVCWMAYPGTTGLSAVDYRLTDPYLDPPDIEIPDIVPRDLNPSDAVPSGVHDAKYAERSIRLRDTFWCIEPFEIDLPVAPLPAAGNGYVTFGNLNSFWKVNSASLGVWARILAAVPRSRLILQAPAGSARKFVAACLSREGVDPDRVEFVLSQSRREYLQTYNRIDIGLDTFPYNGHTTSIDSFWMGVPVITLVGKTIVGRAGWSQLNNLRMPELAALDADHFVNLATSLAGNLRELAGVRASLRGKTEASPLMDTQRFADSMEQAYRTMWTTWCAARLAHTPS